jgi:hypothetical protein
MVFFLDTGNNSTELYPRFAADNLDLVTSQGQQSIYQWNAHGARRELMELKVPEIPLRIGGFSATLRPASVLLERALTYNERHGTLGMNVLNQAQRVTLDLQAMRLTLE